MKKLVHLGLSILEISKVVINKLKKQHYVDERRYGHYGYKQFT